MTDEIPMVTIRSARIMPGLAALHSLLTLLAELRQDVVDLPNAPDDILRFVADFEPAAAGRAGEYRLSLNLSEGLFDWLLALGATDIAVEAIYKLLRHDCISVSDSATPTVDPAERGRL